MSDTFANCYRTGWEYGEGMATLARDLAANPQTTRLDLQEDLAAIVYAAMCFHVAACYYRERLSSESSKHACRGLSDRLQVELSAGSSDRNKIAKMVRNRIELFVDCFSICIETGNLRTLVHFVTGCAASMNNEIVVEDFYPTSLMQDADEFGMLTSVGKKDLENRLNNPRTVNVRWSHALEINIGVVHQSMVDVIRKEMDAIYGSSNRRPLVDGMYRPVQGARDTRRGFAYGMGFSYGRRLWEIIYEHANGKFVRSMGYNSELVAVTIAGMAINECLHMFREHIGDDADRGLVIGLMEQVFCALSSGVVNKSLVEKMLKNRIVLFAECATIGAKDQNYKSLVSYFTGCSSSLRHDIAYTDFVNVRGLKDLASKGCLTEKGIAYLQSKIADLRTVPVEWSPEQERRIVAIANGLTEFLEADIREFYGLA